MDAAIALSSAAVVLAGIASHAFHSWLRQRERERLSASDKTELLGMLKAVDAKLLELKNTAFNKR